MTLTPSASGPSPSATASALRPSPTAWTLIGQAAQAARDRDLLDTVDACERETALQLGWLATRMKEAAPQALVVARS